MLLRQNLSESIVCFSALMLIVISCTVPHHAKAQVSTADLLDLRGAWACQIDSNGVGEKEAWYKKNLSGIIKLPGSIDENGLGMLNQIKDLDKLTRVYKFYGPVWYQKTVDIPSGWRGRNIELLLERVMWESKVWIDDEYLGNRESLCVPHRFRLPGNLSVGKHKITVRIDNRYRFNIGVASTGRMGSPMWTMAVTDESQTTWNGVIGRIELSASDPVWIDRFEVHPIFDQRQIKIYAFIRNYPELKADGTVSASLYNATDTFEAAPVAFSTKTLNSQVLSGANAPLLSQVTGIFYEEYSATQVEITLPFDENINLWDEFSPTIYSVKINLSATSSGGRHHDEYFGTTGIREFVADDRNLKLNNRIVFLRGNQDNCVHPLTGYPPMDDSSWISFLNTYRSYGLNHIRFHSWCPPEAAFAAADRLGMILQVEAPMWDGYGDVGKLHGRAAFIRDESERILNEYGNHPSFCMYSLGNELGPGTELYLQYVIEVLRARDKRRLYTCASAPASNIRNDDFLVGANGITGDWACSLSETCFRGLRQWKARADGDVRTLIASMEKPLIAHEIGQFTSFPDFYSWFVSRKYRGPLKAYYIDTFKTSFEKNFRRAESAAFSSASGQLQLALYKAEIEIMLRTPTLAGFHLNGLSDYPGEGVALIGMLDAMLDWKGFATPGEFRQFCGSTVPLIRMKTRSVRSGDELSVSCEIRHNGPADLENVNFGWKVTDNSGKQVSAGEILNKKVSTGYLNELGTIYPKLPDVSTGTEYTFSLFMENSDVTNSWRFWVYPRDPKAVVSNNNTVVAEVWNDETKKALRAGKNVLLLPKQASIGKSVPAEFYTVFWGKSAESDKVGALGTYCDPSNPALSEFPTRNHADWQWYDLLTNSFAINISAIKNLKPMVHLIDFFKTNRKLSMLMEVRAGKGKLVICSLNLGDNANRTLPQKAMLSSLLNYVQSDQFNPVTALPFDTIDKLLQPL